MMNRKEFYEYVKDNVKEYLPESYKDAEITLQEVEKNNGLKLTGITIPNGDQRIVPRVYLDSFYLEYVIGKDVDSCVGDVVDMYIEAQDKAEFIKMGVPDIFDYEKMKEKLQVRICDQEWNEERLADKVITEHGDFAAYYAVNLKENEEEVGSIPVTVSLMNEWGVSAEQIQADAMVADRKRGVTLMDMNEIIKSMIFGEEPENLLNEKMDMEATMILRGLCQAVPDFMKRSSAWQINYMQWKENDYSDFFGATCPDLYANTRYNLYLRMDKLMKNHLMFLHDRRVPTSNNEAERQLRNYKRKQKQVVSFRSNQSHDYLCKSMSMLVVMRQNESNLFDRVSRILD